MRIGFDKAFIILIKVLTLFSLLLLSFIIIFVFKEGYIFFKEVPILKFITGTTWNPLSDPRNLSIFNIILATLYVSLVAIIIALPIGVGSALLLSGYVKERPRLIIRGLIDIIAGIPSVIFGFIGLMVLVK
ncbi:MAG: phosphate ABC transporter permease subunit PstC, partial [Lutispora sp.]